MTTSEVIILCMELLFGQDSADAFALISCSKTFSSPDVILGFLWGEVRGGIWQDFSKNLNWAKVDKRERW